MHAMKMIGAVALLLLVACERTPEREWETVERPPVPSEALVDDLARDPERLNEVRRLCREDRAAIAEELCIASAMAARRRFMGEGRAPDPTVPDDE